MTLSHLASLDDTELLRWLRDRTEAADADGSSAELIKAETEFPQIAHAAYSRKNSELRRAVFKLQQVLEAKRRPEALPPLTGHFVSGERLIYVVNLPNGGRDVMAYDWVTGGFVRDLSYLGDDDLERIGAGEFTERLRKLREAKS